LRQKQQINSKTYIMNNTKSVSISFALTVVAALAASAVSSHAQSASATISGVAAGGGTFDYTLTVLNTGSDSLNSIWYGWTLSGNNLPGGSEDPTSPANTLGWANILDSNSIQWENTLGGTVLLPGQSGVFTFASTATPTAITTLPSGPSVAYVSATGPSSFGENSPGSASPAFTPTLVTAPEPSSVSLLIVGSLGLLATGWRKFRTQ
jgi:hypothetical protein